MGKRKGKKNHAKKREGVMARNFGVDHLGRGKTHGAKEEEESQISVNGVDLKPERS